MCKRAFLSLPSHITTHKCIIKYVVNIKTESPRIFLFPIYTNPRDAGQHKTYARDMKIKNNSNTSKRCPITLPL